MIKTIKHNLALKLDSIGFLASTLCAIHCAAMPFILLFLTFYGLTFVASPLVEVLFISSSVLIGGFTFSHGYFNHHKKLYPFALFAIGLAIVLSGHFFLNDHSHAEINNDNLIILLVSPFGALLIGVGHYLNRKLSKHKNVAECRH